MAYLDPASNPGSKPQRFSAVLEIAKVPLQISFKHSNPFLAFLVNFWSKTFSSATAATLGGTFSKRNQETFQENKNKNPFF